MKIQLRAEQVDDLPFREGLTVDKVYDIHERNDHVGTGDGMIYYVNGKAYSALRFDVISGAAKPDTVIPLVRRRRR